MFKRLSRYPNYEINENGDVRRVGSDLIRKTYSVNGHPKIIIEGKTEYISRLVAETYIFRPEGNNEVLHLDQDTSNNNVNNLVWSNHSEIQRASYIYRPNRVVRRVKIVETGEVFDSIRSCAKSVNGYPSGIRRCLKGETKTYKGFHYVYVV